MTRPTDYPEFATSDVVNGVSGVNNAVEPSAAVKLLGIDRNEKPPRQWFNWLFRTINNWIEWFDSSNKTIDTQSDFEAIIERVGANDYKIIDSVIDVTFKYLSGGYLVSGILSGGDTWGDIKTNNCTNITFEQNAVLDFTTLKGHLEVNTDDCILKNVSIKGTTTGVAVNSFYLNAERVTFDNCKAHTRISSVDFVGFQGSSITLDNYTSKYMNCVVYDIEGADKLYGFGGCMNLSNCTAYNLDSSSGSDICYGFSACDQINTCYSYNLKAGNANVYGFAGCDQVTSCVASTLEANNGTVYGFSTCTQISGSKTTTLTSTLNNASGFNSCDQISACLANGITADTLTKTASGFNSCDQISACKVTNIVSLNGTAEGFKGCTYGSSLWTNEAVNSGNDWIDSTDAQITNKVSTPDIWT